VPTCAGYAGCGIFPLHCPATMKKKFKFLFKLKGFWWGSGWMKGDSSNCE
jgi:hypothetical protein